MKVLHCLAQLPQSTGSGIYFTSVVNGMVKRGHDTAILYGVQEPFNIYFEGVDKVYPVEFKTDELPFPIVGMSDEMPYESTVYSEMTDEQYAQWLAAFRARLEKAKQEFQPDIIFAHHLWILSSLIREVFPNTKIIGISHGTDLRQAKKNPWLKEKYVHHVDNFNAYFAISPSDIAEITAIFGIPAEKTQIMGGGFNPYIFHPKGRKGFNGTFRLLYAGKLSHAKGVYELAKALPKIVETYPNTELRLCGNATPEQKKELSALANNLPQLTFQPAVPQAQLGDLIRKADIFILPSYYEGSALIVIEALATGTRAVASEIPGLMWLLGEDLKNSGIIEYIPLPGLHDIDVPNEDEIPQFVEDISKKVLLQMSRVENNEPVTSEDLAKIDRHSWERMLDQMDEFICQK